MNDCETNIYTQFCKGQFQALFDKHEDTLAEIKMLNNKLFIDNGAGKSLVSRIREIEYKATQLSEDVVSHLDEQNTLKRNWSDVFYTLVKNALWGLIIVVATYLATRVK